MNEKEQIHLETLFQMGNVSFQEEYEFINEKGQRMYYFPYGIVSVNYFVVEDKYIQAQFTMETSKGSKNVVNRRIPIGR